MGLLNLAISWDVRHTDVRGTVSLDVWVISLSVTVINTVIKQGQCW